MKPFDIVVSQHSQNYLSNVKPSGRLLNGFINVVFATKNKKK